MPFEQLLSDEEQAEIRQAIGDVASGTFGQHDVIFVRKTLIEGVYGESPTESKTEHSLKGLVLAPEAIVNEVVDRSQIDWDLSVMFYRDYLSEEGVFQYMQPDQIKREHEFEIDNLRYRISNFRWDAQFVDDYLLVFVELERM
jgi:hypothetical protein